MAENRKRMTIFESVKMLKIVYEGGKLLSFIRNPLSYAVRTVCAVRRTVNNKKKGLKKWKRIIR